MAPTRAKVVVLLFGAVMAAAVGVLWLRGTRGAARAPPVAVGATAWFAGAVRAPSGEALPAASVHPVWVPQDGEPRALPAAAAGAKGAYRLEVELPAEPGLLLLIATAPGRESAGRRVDPTEHRQEFVLPAGGTTVSLHARDPGGNPVAGAEVVLSVELLEGDPQAALVLDGKTGPLGNLDFDALPAAPARLHWTVRSRGCGSISGWSEKPAGLERVAIEAILRAGATLTGTALEGSTPVEGLTVSLRESEGGWGEKARTDARGVFVVEEVPAGVPLLLSLISDDHMLSGGADDLPLSIPAQARRQSLGLAVQPAGAVEVKVGAASGAPIEGVEVDATPADHRMTSRKLGISDREGRVHLGGLRVDTAWQLEARHPDYAPSFADQVRPSRSAERIAMILMQGGAVAGKVEWDDGSPAAGIEIYVHAIQQIGNVIQGLREHATVRTGEGGEFRVDHLSPSQVRVEVRAAARMAWSPVAAQAMQAAVQEGHTAWVEVSPLPRPAALRAEISLGSGVAPLELFAEISLMRPGAHGAPHVATVQHGRDRSFTLNGLEPGEYDVAVRLADHGVARLDVSLLAGRTTEARFEFPTQPALDGRLLHADGSPAAGAEIDIYSPTGGSQKTHQLGGRAPDNLTGNRTRTRPDGTFHLPGLPPGRYVAYARHPDEAPFERPLDVVGPNDSIELRFPPPSHCRAKVLDAEGKPLADRPVVAKASLPGRHTASVVTDELGVARFDRLPEGEYQVRAVVPGQPTGSCAVAAGASAEIVLHAAADPRGR